MIKTDAEGEIEWERSGYAGSAILTLLQTWDSGFILGGRGHRFDFPGSFCAIRVDSLGEELWAFTSNRFEDGECFKVLQMDDGDYTFAGTVDNGNRQSDFRLYRTEPDPLIVPRFIDPTYPSNFMVESAYPNPFNGMVTIPYRLPASTVVKVIVHDSFGKEVVLLQNEFKPSGNHQITWIPNNVPSGTYLVQVGLASSVSMVPGVGKMNNLRTVVKMDVLNTERTTNRRQPFQ
jgi:hypothetical protein